MVLGWTPPAGTLSGFRIERTLVATSATVVLELPDPAATGYTDTPLQPATAYRYVVYAYNAAGQSPASNALEATTFPSVTPPNAPTNASASITEQGGTWFVSLRWRDRSFNEEGYYVERSVNQADWTRIADLPGSVTARYGTYDDLTAAAGTTYYYRVQSYRGGGSAVSGWSNTASVATPGGATPQAPANLAATFIGYTYVTLAWEDTSDNETAFILERSLDEFATVAQTYTLPANSTSTNVYNIARATMHYFRIKARNVNVDSAWSDIVDVRTRGN